ncbi:HEI10, partial [Acrasis kona]
MVHCHCARCDADNSNTLSLLKKKPESLPRPLEPCGHVLCASCLNKLKSKDGVCPLCDFYNQSNKEQPLDIVKKALPSFRYTILVFCTEKFPEYCEVYLKDLNDYTKSLRSLGGEVICVTDENQDTVDVAVESYGFTFKVITDIKESIASHYDIVDMTLKKKLKRLSANLLTNRKSLEVKRASIRKSAQFGESLTIDVPDDIRPPSVIVISKYKKTPLSIYKSNDLWYRPQHIEKFIRTYFYKKDHQKSLQHVTKEEGEQRFKDVMSHLPSRSAFSEYVQSRSPNYLNLIKFFDDLDLLISSYGNFNVTGRKSSVDPSTLSNQLFTKYFTSTSKFDISGSLGSEYFNLIKCFDIDADGTPSIKRDDHYLQKASEGKHVFENAAGLIEKLLQKKVFDSDFIESPEYTKILPTLLA